MRAVEGLKRFAADCSLYSRLSLLYSSGSRLPADRHAIVSSVHCVASWEWWPQKLLLHLWYFRGEWHSTCSLKEKIITGALLFPAHVKEDCSRRLVVTILGEITLLFVKLLKAEIYVWLFCEEQANVGQGGSYGESADTHRNIHILSTNTINLHFCLTLHHEVWLNHKFT